MTTVLSSAIEVDVSAGSPFTDFGMRFLATISEGPSA
jgi:hypothetical protein